MESQFPTPSTPLTAPAAPSDIPTYDELRQAYDDGTSNGKVKGIIEAMQFARLMAVEHGLLIAGLPTSQRSTLTKLIAEQQGITLPPPKRTKGKPWMRPEKHTGQPGAIASGNQEGARLMR